MLDISTAASGNDAFISSIGPNFIGGGLGSDTLKFGTGFLSQRGVLRPVCNQPTYSCDRLRNIT